MTTKKLVLELPLAKEPTGYAPISLRCPGQIEMAGASGCGLIDFAECHRSQYAAAVWLELKAGPAINTVVELTNLVQREQLPRSDIAAPPKKATFGRGHRLLTPSDTFWGVTFLPKVAIDDLIKL